MTISLQTPVQLKTLIQHLVKLWGQKKNQLKLKKTSKVTAVVAVTSIFVERNEIYGALIPGTRRVLAIRTKAPFFAGKSLWVKNLSEKKRIGQISKKFAPTSKKLELNNTSSKLKHAKAHLNWAKKPDPNVSYGLKVKSKTTRILHDSGSSGDVLFVQKGSIKHISVVKQAVSQLWGTSTGTFNTDKVGESEISFVEYSTNKKFTFSQAL